MPSRGAAGLVAGLGRIGWGGTGYDEWMTSHHEIEATYGPGPDTPVPDLTQLVDVVSTRDAGTTTLRADYLDTPDLRLARAGVSLRRRTGGVDEGWHLKVPSGVGRTEHQWPLGPDGDPPAELRLLAQGWVRGDRLLPVATIVTERTTTELVGADDLLLAELVDDHVESVSPDGRPLAWREWEVELVGAGPELLEATDRLMADHGVGRADVGRKLLRVLGDRVPRRAPTRTPQPGKPVWRLVHSRLVELVDELARRDVEVRAGSDDTGVHQMRVTCRRFRALLATYRPVLDRTRTDPVRDELHWLADQLAGPRDAAVVEARLFTMVGEEPPALARGPLAERLRSTLAAAGGRGPLEEALSSERYFTLRTALDDLAAEPPWGDLADSSARAVVPARLRKELRRVRRHTGAALAEGTVQERVESLHELRRAVKRLRYAAETARPVGGKQTRCLTKAAKHVTSQLGELQDTVVARDRLLAMAREAEAAGEPSFTLGRLHAREEATADRLLAEFDVEATVARLEHRVRLARKEIARA